MIAPKVCGVVDPKPAPEVQVIDIERLHELSGILAPWSRYVVGPLDAEQLRQLVDAEIARREALEGQQ